MIRFLTPDELRVFMRVRAAVPGNGAALAHGVRAWLAGQLAEHAGALLAGEARRFVIDLKGPARDELIRSAGESNGMGSIGPALHVWCVTVHDALEELVAAGWGVIPPADQDWALPFTVLGPCARHGVPVDPVVAGCDRCLAELPVPDPDALLRRQGLTRLPDAPETRQ